MHKRAYLNAVWIKRPEMLDRTFPRDQRAMNRVYICEGLYQWEIYVFKLGLIPKGLYFMRPWVYSFRFDFQRRRQWCHGIGFWSFFSPMAAPLGRLC